MGIAVELYFDEQSDRLIRDWWGLLHERGLASFMHESGSRPHVSFAVFEDAPKPELMARTAAFARKTAPVKLHLTSLGIFPGNESVVFLAAKVTEHLLRIHADYQTAVCDWNDQQWPHYRPDQWVPHCTLALELPASNLPQTILALQEVFRPIEATVEHIGIVEFRPVRELACWPCGI